MEFQPDTFTILILVVMGTAAVVAYSRTKKHNARMQTHGVRVQGVVVRNKIQWGRITTVRPIVRFVTQEGQTIEALAAHGVASAIPGYSEGATVTVVYDRENPAEFEITHASRRYS
ncbi:DUF3592 domain-containing protein [Hymenobacter sp. BT635]|uniref:DUF3592 domain-containing protein n=1 Tax=Hymenobacter nitidus TaxID=2880929 RepID=A0ABS8AF48_9BACT|nr:DUF3592 domain-containing protein [Hymenobacter nitidus]MCB2378992.1 DUF3592 domain-containing protein [Hymenobacter nitidus]